MLDKEEIERRLEALDWTLYKLAKEFSKLRSEENGKVSSATRYHSAISKSLENLSNSKLETVETIIQALGGEMIIVWDMKQKKYRKNKKNKAR